MHSPPSVVHMSGGQTTPQQLSFPSLWGLSAELSLWVSAGACGGKQGERQTLARPLGASTPGRSEDVESNDPRAPGLAEIILWIRERLCNFEEPWGTV